MKPPRCSSSSLAAVAPSLRNYLAQVKDTDMSSVHESFIHDYIAGCSEFVTAAIRRGLRARVATLREACCELRKQHRDREADRLAFLTRFFSGSGSVGPRSALLRRAVNEGAFALLIVLEMGGVDANSLSSYRAHTAIFAAVIERNERILRNFADQLGIEWSGLMAIGAETRISVITNN